MASYEEDSQQDAGAPRVPVQQPSKKSENELYLWIKDNFLRDAAHSEEWRDQARKDFDFVAGDQWELNSYNRMVKDEKRQPITMNKTATFLKMVAGLEVNGRHEIVYLPRGTDEGQVLLNEDLTQASKWMGQQCDAEDHQSTAFRDCATCGMGWCLSDDAMVRLPNTHFATTRLYSGSVIQIDLENGKQLTGTPNHPVLTDRGWKPLYAVDEGDNLITSAFLERVGGFPVEQFDKVETRLKDKIYAFRTGRETLRFITTPDDFNSDGAGSKIHIVYANRLLSRKFRYAARVQQLKQLSLTWRDLITRTGSDLFTGGVLGHAINSAINQLSIGWGHSPRPQLAGVNYVPQCVPGIFEPSPDSFGIKIKPLSNLQCGQPFFKVQSGQFRSGNADRFSSVMLSEGESRVFQAPSNACSRYSEFIPDFRDWKPILEIEFSKLRSSNCILPEFMTRIKRRVVKFVDKFPVHDVGTSLGLFIAGNIITSNTEARIDFEKDPDGMYLEESLDPIEMYWDRTSKKKNLADCQRIYRVRKMRLEDARALADSLGGQNVPDQDLDATWALGVDQRAVKPYEEVRLKTGHGNANAPDGAFQLDPNTEVHIVQVQWWEREPYFRVAHPATGEEMQLDKDQFTALKKHAADTGYPGEIPHAKQVRKVFKQAFVGSKIICVGDAPVPDTFSFSCMTGELHRGKGVWHGLVRLLRDPQMWVNKLFSQIIHILNTTAKGGILAERGAFPDIREAQRTFARPDAITIVEDRAIRENRIMQKPGVGLAAPFVQMLDLSNKAFYDVSGVNIELMGLRDSEQPGVLEAQRKQAGMTVLATLFDARALFLKNVGRIRLYFIQNFLSDGRIMRIVGQQGYQAIRLVRERTAGEYDIEVSDAPTSPDIKSQTWAMLMQLAPFFKGSMTPQIASIFLEYSPLPTKAVAELKQALQTPTPMQVQQMQMGQQHAQAQIEHTQAQTARQAAGALQAKAAAARDIGQAILDIAQAGAQVQPVQAAQAEAGLLNMLPAQGAVPNITRPPAPGPNILPQSPYAVEPQGVNSPQQLPMPPQPPMAGQGQVPVRNQLDPATLARIASALPGPKTMQ
jgi:hypothetical protein